MESSVEAGLSAPNGDWEWNRGCRGLSTRAAMLLVRAPTPLRAATPLRAPTSLTRAATPLTKVATLFVFL